MPQTNKYRYNAGTQVYIILYIKQQFIIDINIEFAVISTIDACPAGSDSISPQCTQMALVVLAPYLHLALVQMLQKQKSCMRNRSKLKRFPSALFISAIMILQTFAMLTQVGNHLSFL